VFLGRKDNLMKICFIGFGEAAGAIIGGWGAARAGSIRVFDIKTLDPATSKGIAIRAAALGVKACQTAAEALAGADLVFSAVTADQAVAAVEAYSGAMPKGAVWCDLNSCAPKSKQTAEAVVAAAGGRYLDVAVMAPVYPARNMVPCLVSGPCGDDVTPLLAALPMNVRQVGDEVGRASSIKMVRSIMVKGLEALTAECTLAAVAAGVEEEVFPSLKSGHPYIDMEARSAYNFERTLVHGQRRAAEMDEVAKMLRDLNLPDGMSSATAAWQRYLSDTDITLPDADITNYQWFAAKYLLRTKAAE